MSVKKKGDTMKIHIKPRRPVDNEQGFALVLCLIVIAVLSLVGASAVLVSTTNQNIVQNYTKQTQAFNATEGGIQSVYAQIKNDILYRGDEVVNPHTSSAFLSLGDRAGSYAVTISDGLDDNLGLYDPLLPTGVIKLQSTGTLWDSTQNIEVFVELTPDPAVTVDIDKKAVITSGDNTGSGPHVVNGYDEFGNLDTTNQVETFAVLPDINQDALKALADFSFDSFGNGEAAVMDAAGVVDFWKNPPTNTKPWITHIKGNLNVTGNRTLYGVFFIEGTTVDLRGTVRVHGILYAPNATVHTEIHGGGSPWDQPVMGQVVCGTGGVVANGNHADVQLVPEYVDALKNLGGDTMLVEFMQGTWKQY